jgi:hypothetical protein
MPDEEINQQQEGQLASDPVDPADNNTVVVKDNSKKRLFLIFFLLIVIVIPISVLIFWRSQDKSNPASTQNIKPVLVKLPELATRKYFNNGKVTQVLEEKNIKNEDGTLETVVTNNGQEISRQLYLKDKILSLIDGVLTQQVYKSVPPVINYRTSGERYLDIVKSNPNLPKKSTVLNGKKVTVYTVGGAKTTGFNFIKSAYAQNFSSDVINISVEDGSEQLQKIEDLDPVTSQIKEEITYKNGPTIVNSQLSDGNNNTATSEGEQNKVFPTIAPTLDPIISATASPNIPTIVPSDNPVPVSSPEADMLKKAKQTKEIPIDPPKPLPPDKAITLFPLSVIPTTTGYTNMYIDLVSKAFQIHELTEKSLKETGMFDPREFVAKYIRVKVDGVEEILNQNPNITVDTLYANDPSLVTGVIRFEIPQGLLPGYHTVEVFAVDSWYLAPNIMVTLPQADEDVLELELKSKLPPIAYLLPDESGFEISLSGKNLIKPFSMIFTDSQGKQFPIDDSNITLDGTELMTIKLPPTFPMGIYSLTISKGSQTIYRPNYIGVSKRNPSAN